MCGLVGIIGSAQLPDTAIKAFGDMLYMDAVRGWDSTGVARVDIDDVVDTHKKAVSAMVYMDKAYDKFISGKKRPRLLIGHNRAATQGSVTATNAHPFTHGDITLVHNGTLFWHKDICEGSEHFDVDSEAICHAVATIGAKDTLEALSGAYALVWHDASDNTLNFARNDDRPLWIAEDVAGTMMSWASEKHMLLCALERRVKSVKFDVKLLPAREHHKYQLSLKDDPIINEFVEYKMPVYKPNRWQNAWDDGYYPKTSTNTIKATATSTYPKDKTVMFTVTRITKQYNTPVRGILEGHDTYDSDQVVKAYNVDIKDVKFGDKLTGRVDYITSHYNYGSKVNDKAVVVKSLLKAKAEVLQLPNYRDGFIKGARGIYVSPATFLGHVKGGCSVCGRTILPSDAENVKWYDMDVLLCPTCNHIH